MSTTTADVAAPVDVAAGLLALAAAQTRTEHHQALMLLIPAGLGAPVPAVDALCEQGVHSRFLGCPLWRAHPVWTLSNRIGVIRSQVLPSEWWSW